MNARSALKWLAYHSGALGAIHRLRNRDRLTVVMFHRVLPDTSPEWRGADPTYTVSDRLFSECLDFFKRQYTVVPLEALLAACDGRQRLPRRSLLITFDDGWADNEAVALPLLRRAGLPAVIFVVTDAIDEAPGPWWQETVFAAWRNGKLSGGSGEALWRAVCGASSSSPDFAVADGVLALTARLAKLMPGARQLLLAPYDIGTGARQMLAPAQLRHLLRNGVEVGAHGATHVPLTLVECPEAELRRSRDDLRQLRGDGLAPVALSFPHGRYTSEIVQLARAAGYRAQFTSDSRLNPISEGRPASDVLGRISVQASEIADANGRLRPEFLALWLFLRPVESPA